MASSQDWRSHQTPRPPPPYEANQFSPHDAAQTSFRPHSSAEDYAIGNQQTIPKTAHSVRTQIMSGEGRKPNRLNGDGSGQQVKKYNQNTPFDQASSPRKRSLPSPRSNNGDQQFVRSLAMPKSCLDHVSIEPLAFLAIVALYIEFPALQDLIWTKICLEVLSENPSFNQQAQSNSAIHNQSPNGALGSGLNSSTSPSSADGHVYEMSPSNLSQQVIIDHESLPNYDSFQSRSRILCDRLNKRNVPNEIRQQIVDIDSLFWLKYQILVCTLCLLASPYWGGLSDKIGRLFPMNVPIIAGAICNAILLVFGLLISLNSYSVFQIEWLYIGALIVGLSGGQGVLIMSMFSFLGDNSTSEERSRRVTVLESVIFLGHSLGFYLSKMIMMLGLAPPERPWLNKHFVSFGTCLVLNIFALIYSTARLRHRRFHRFLNNFEREQRESAIFGSSSTEYLGRGPQSQCQATDLVSCGGGPAGDRLRELTLSTPDDPDGPIARSDKSNWSFWDAMITFRYYRETYQIATKKRDTRAIILLLLLSGFISALNLAALMSLFFIYVKMDPFNWSTSQYSQWNSVSSITRGVALISLTITMRFSSCWNIPDPIVAAVGFLAKGAGSLLIGLAQSSSLLTWSLVPFTFSEYAMPPIRSLLSKLVVREELCKIYSCLAALQNFCFILGNIAFYVAFTTFTDQNIFRICYLVVAGIEFCAVILLIIIYTAIRRQMPHILAA